MKIISKLPICGKLSGVSDLNPEAFPTIYTRFRAPIAELDCGRKCAPYNEFAIPFCCDTHHAVPTAYNSEWVYLQANTDLWHLWEGKNTEDFAYLREETPSGQVLIACLGYEHCQREFRSITCRAFPFFPYFNSNKEFLGLAYYWEYEDRCWVISNLQVVSASYLQSFIKTYEALFVVLPEEISNYSYLSAYMRRSFQGYKRSIPLLHRNGHAYKVSPNNERMRRVKVESLPKFGSYKIAASMPFPDEMG
jgi:hypothetical protein